MILGAVVEMHENCSCFEGVGGVVRGLVGCGD